MKLLVYPKKGILCTQQGEKVSFGEPYELDADRCFTVVKINKQMLGITIWQGNRALRSEAIPLLSDHVGLMITGNTPNGLLMGPAQNPYALELTRHRAIFPLWPLVEALIGNDISHAQISPMTTPGLVDYLFVGLSGQIHTDGIVTKEEDKYPSRQLVTVTQAAYVIKTQNNRVVHVYLWPAAQGLSCEILEVINTIRKGAKQAQLNA